MISKYLELQFLNNNIFIFSYIAFSLLYITVFNSLNPVQQFQIVSYLKNPFIITTIILFIIISSFVNLLISFLTVLMLFISFKTSSSSSPELVEGFKNDDDHKFLKHLGINPKKLTNAIFEGINENKKKKLHKKIEEPTREKMENTTKSSNKDKMISKRKFNLDDEDDKNLLATREICKDIINRINYEYEDNDYLLKYIASRIEEIVDLNGLVDGDGDD